MHLNRRSSVSLDNTILTISNQDILQGKQQSRAHNELPCAVLSSETLDLLFQLQFLFQLTKKEALFTMQRSLVYNAIKSCSRCKEALFATQTNLNRISLITDS